MCPRREASMGVGEVWTWCTGEVVQWAAGEVTSGAVARQRGRYGGWAVISEQVRSQDFTNHNLRGGGETSIGRVKIFATWWCWWWGGGVGGIAARFRCSV